MALCVSWQMDHFITDCVKYSWYQGILPTEFFWEAIGKSVVHFEKKKK